MKKKLILLLLCVILLLPAACGGGAAKEAAPAADAASSSGIYRVIVKDESGRPVQGVVVQLCSDQACQMGETDVDGVAAYPEAKEGNYTVHVYSVPEGFAEDDREYPVPETCKDVNIVLKAAQ